MQAYALALILVVAAAGVVVSVSLYRLLRAFARLEGMTKALVPAIESHLRMQNALMRDVVFHLRHRPKAPPPPEAS